MKTIIAIWGHESIGKSAVIWEIFRKLNSKETFTILENKGDIKAIGTYHSKKIGIEGQGDPISRQGQSLAEFAHENCDIIVCACRTKGKTVNNIVNISQSHIYEVIWTSPFSGGDKGTMPNGIMLNDEFSDAIIRLIDKLW